MSSVSEPVPGCNALVAYFSMEIAMDPAIPTYSGGLGILAGDTVRSAADLGLPMVAVTMAHRKGYFHQHLSADGTQTEQEVPWNPADHCELMTPTVKITVQDRPLLLRAWRYLVKGVSGHVVPIYLMDADVEPNDAWDRRLTDHLYGGDTYYRLCQEAILGMGGARMVEALGHQLSVFHMNEGHAALLSLALLEDRLAGTAIDHATDEDLEAVRRMCVFTTHTPVPAGHDRFGMDQAIKILGKDRTTLLERVGACPEGLLNMTYVALNFSRFVNGVAMQHGRVSQAMFPDFPVTSITNGVHAGTWVAPAFQQLFDRHLPDWRTDNFYLHNVIGIDAEEIAAAHAAGKARLINEIIERTGVVLRPDVFTIGFARRAAAYKRADLLFTDIDRLVEIAHRHGGLQIVYAGKSHPHDEAGKQLIRRVFVAAAKLATKSIEVLYLEDYDWPLGAILTSGVDLWLNTPERPHEASGTSGMKAALNGVPSLSTLDGWWIEGWVEGVTGWAIAESDQPALEAESLYQKLDTAILPVYTEKPEQWHNLMRLSIALNGAFFNTHRMLLQYERNAYFPPSLSLQPANMPHKVCS